MIHRRHHVPSDKAFAETLPLLGNKLLSPPTIPSFHAREPSDGGGRPSVGCESSHGPAVPVRVRCGVPGERGRCGPGGMPATSRGDPRTRPSADHREPPRALRPPPVRTLGTSRPKPIPVRRPSNAAVRETADKWYQEAERFATDLALNRPLYDAFVDLDVSQEDPETKYAVRKILRDFRLAGVDRDAATRERIKGLRDEITATGQDFDRTIREDERSIQVDGAADLAGLPADFVKAHPPGPDGKITTS